MLLSELKTEFHRCKVIAYASDHNTAVEKTICLQHIVENLYKGKDVTDKYGQISCRLYVYYEALGVGIDVGGIAHPSAQEDQKLMSRVPLATLQGPKAFIQSLDTVVAEGGRITNAEIALARHISPERAEVYVVARQRYMDKDAEKRAQKQAERETEDAAYCKERNTQAQMQIENAIRIIQTGGELKNAPITFYKDKYSYKRYCLINHLARVYGIEIPLKVQGWINKSLVSVKITNAQVTGYRYKDSKSKAFANYIGILVTAIRNAHPADISA